MYDFTNIWLGSLWVILLLGACSIDEDPRSLLTPDEFFQEDRDAQSSVDAIYGHINSGTSVYARHHWLINGLVSDLGTYRGSDPNLSALATLGHTASNEVIWELWQGLYQAIYAANFAIENIPKVPIPDEEKTEFMAEARLLRAMFYFDLVRYFGAVPILEKAHLTSEQLTAESRSPIDSVYSFIEHDLTYAFENLPARHDPGRPTLYTAAGLLAKFYLTQRNFSRAAQASRLVIQSGIYDLQPDYADLFTVRHQNNAEILFSANFNISDGAPMNIYLLPRTLHGRSRILPTASFFEDFDAKDRRESVTVLRSIKNDQGQAMQIEPHLSKYWDEISEPRAMPTAVDLPLLRYADILLLHAEALNELRNGSSTEALNAINSVRNRARFDGSVEQATLPPLNSMGRNDFRQAILDERKRELSWEGHRWFDLVRFDQLKTLTEAAKPDVTVEAKHHLFPIPQKELQLNPSLGSQNPGY